MLLKPREEARQFVPRKNEFLSLSQVNSLSFQKFIKRPGATSVHPPSQKVASQSFLKDSA